MLRIYWKCTSENSLFLAGFIDVFLVSVLKLQGVFLGRGGDKMMSLGFDRTLAYFKAVTDSWSTDCLKGGWDDFRFKAVA